MKNIRKSLRVYRSIQPGRALRLQFETLEPRRVLAGLTVSAFLDNDASGTFDPTVDVPAAHRLIYLDLNANGVRETSEPIAATNEQGLASFADLPSGDYLVRLLTADSAQRQTTHVGPASQSVLAHHGASERLLSDGQLNHLWSLTPDGTLQPISFTGVPSVSLPGALLDAVQLSDSQSLLSAQGDGTNVPRLYRFTFATGQLDPIDLQGLQSDEWIERFIPAGDSIWAVVAPAAGDSDQQAGRHRLMQITVDAQASTGQATELLPLTSHLVTSAGASFVVSVETTPSGTQELQLTSFGSDIRRLGTPIIGTAVSVESSADGSWVMVGLASGGVELFRFDGQTLQRTAILGDAATPRAMVGDQLVAPLRDSTRRLAVWSANSGAIVGVTSLAADHQRLTSLLIADGGEKAFVGGDAGIETVDLRAPQPIPLELADGDHATIEIGVRAVGETQPLQLPDLINRSIVEDSSDRIDVEELLAAGDDLLWVRLMWAPQHGTLVPTADGSWQYRPDPDYFGLDSARFRAYDGINAQDVTLRWDISPVDDPPIDLIVRMQPTAEDVPHGTTVGYVSVVDPDTLGDYRVTTLDPRFEVSAGQIVFVGGQVDYETEPVIRLTLQVESPAGNAPIIVKSVDLNLTNVDEPPTGIVLERTTVSENSRGERVGPVRVLDPDVDSHYDLYVSDPRFRIVDGQLVLADNVELDFETEPEIPIVIQATEAGEGSGSIAETVTISVIDTNDPPRDIILGSNRVPRNTQGAIIGTVSVDDPDQDDYQITVLDERLEIVDGVLKVRDSTVIDEDALSTLEIELVAVADNGDQLSRQIPLVVIPARSPHQNPRNPLDVNDDGIVTPLDALILINDLNRNPSGQLPQGEEGEALPIKPDVNGDGILSPLDVLIIINNLNRTRSQGGEGEAPASHVAESDYYAPPVSLPSPWQSDQRRDRELELLIDQLARQQG